MPGLSRPGSDPDPLTTLGAESAFAAAQPPLAADPIPASFEAADSQSGAIEVSLAAPAVAAAQPDAPSPVAEMAAQEEPVYAASEAQVQDRTPGPGVRLAQRNEWRHVQELDITPVPEALPEIDPAQPFHLAQAPLAQAPHESRHAQEIEKAQEDRLAQEIRQAQEAPSQQSPQRQSFQQQPSQQSPQRQPFPQPSQQSPQRQSFPQQPSQQSPPRVHQQQPSQQQPMQQSPQRPSQQSPQRQAPAWPQPAPALPSSNWSSAAPVLTMPPTLSGPSPASWPQPAPGLGQPSARTPRQRRPEWPAERPAEVRRTGHARIAFFLGGLLGALVLSYVFRHREPTAIVTPPPQPVTGPGEGAATRLPRAPVIPRPVLPGEPSDSPRQPVQVAQTPPVMPPPAQASTLAKREAPQLSLSPPGPAVSVQTPPSPPMKPVLLPKPVPPPRPAQDPHPPVATPGIGRPVRPQRRVNNDKPAPPPPAPLALKPVPALSRADLRSAMLSAEPSFSGCIHEGWGSDVSIGITVGATGDVQKAEVLGSLGQSETGRCLAQRVHKIRFPPFTQGAAKQFFWPYHLPAAAERSAAGPDRRGG